MTGTTVSGYPYVTPTDHPVEFPSHSQALANKLEAAGGMATGAAAPNTAAGWTGSGVLTKQGKLVVCVFSFSKATWVAGETFGDIPAPFRPGTALYFVGAVRQSAAPITLRALSNGVLSAVLAGPAGGAGIDGSVAWFVP